MYSFLVTHRVVWEAQTGACMREAGASNNYRNRVDLFLLPGDSYLLHPTSNHACQTACENEVKSLDSTYYLDNCGESRANTCAGLQPS